MLERVEGAKCSSRHLEPAQGEGEVGDVMNH